MSGRGAAAEKTPIVRRLAQGMLIGLGAVIPGVSGGVLCVVFGLYEPIMVFIAEPVRRFRSTARSLWPVLLGVAAGFLGVSRLLGALLTRYPETSACVFAGLIGGTLPPLVRQARAKGRGRVALAAPVAFAVIALLLTTLRAVDVQMAPGAGGFLFGGVCLALSVIVPGLSFSTLLMPLGLYTPLLDGIGRFDLAVLLPAAFGATATAALLARAVERLLARHGAAMAYAVIGIVMAATLAMIPYGSFVASVPDAASNGLSLAAGVIAGLALDRFNSNMER